MAIQAVLLVASAYYVLAYVGVALARLSYPFELEWLEGAALDQVLRVLRGEAMYAAPSLAYVPLNYAPLYFWASALVAQVAGTDFLALRLLSVASSLAVFWFIHDLVWRERHSRLAALAGVGLFAATYRLGGAWLDLARADSFALAILLGGVWALRAGERDMAAGIVAGLLFVLAFMAKQSSATSVAPLVVWTLAVNWRRGVPLLATVGIAGAIAVLSTNAATGGWFGYYAFDVARRHSMDMSLLMNFPIGDLARHFWPGMSVLVVSAIWNRRWWWSRPGGFHLSLLAGLIGTSWLLRLYRGGYDNVLMTAHAGLSIAVGLAMSRWSDAMPPGTKGRRLLLAGLCGAMVVQLGILGWDPMKQLPTTADRAGWQKMVEGLSAMPGEVLVSSHPYVARLAGKPPLAHVMPFMDVVKGADGPVEAGLLRDMRGALSAHRYSVLVLDNRDWLSDEALRAGYRFRARVFPGPEVGWPVTGMHTRPEWILTPGGRETVP